MPPRKRMLHQAQRLQRATAARYRAPPAAFASATSESALEALVDAVTFTPKAPAAHMQNWAGTFSSDAPTHDGAFSTLDRRVLAPHTVEQVVAIVELARRRRIPLRAVGRLHSPSDLPFSLGWTIRTDELCGVISVDHDALRVRALAGTYIHTLNAALARHDPPLGVHNLGSISEQTIAGLVSTASHGSGAAFPVMSADVLALDIVCPLDSGAQVLSCSRTERPELFNASLCGLGATGVIVGVTLSVEHAFRLRQVCEDASIDALLGPPPADLAAAAEASDVLATRSAPEFYTHPHWLGVLLAADLPLPAYAAVTPPRSQGAEHIYPFAPVAPSPAPASAPAPWAADDVQRRIDALVHSAEHVRFLWSPHAERVIIDRASRTDAPAELAGRLSAAYSAGVLQLTQLLLWASRYHRAWPGVASRVAHRLSHPRLPRLPREPDAAPGGLAPLETTSSVSVRVDDAPAIFNFDCLFPQYTVEYAIPHEYTGAALVALRTWLDLEHARDDGVRTHFPIEVRFVDADGIWMSHCYGRRTCFIGLVQYRPYHLPVRYRRLFARFERLMRAFDGRPHWAKTHSMYRADLAPSYPHLDDWLRVVAAHDPAHLLVNPYVARHLFDEHASGRQSVFQKSRL